MTDDWPHAGQRNRKERNNTFTIERPSSRPFVDLDRVPIA